MVIKTADGKNNFKTCFNFLIVLLSFSQRYIANIIGVAYNSQVPNAICSKGYLITFKVLQQPFCKLQEGIRLRGALFNTIGDFSINAINCINL
jgi:hypothetical protein